MNLNICLWYWLCKSTFKWDIFVTKFDLTRWIKANGSLKQIWCLFFLLILKSEKHSSRPDSTNFRFRLWRESSRKISNFFNWRSERREPESRPSRSISVATSLSSLQRTLCIARSLFWQSTEQYLTMKQREQVFKMEESLQPQDWQKGKVSSADDCSAESG